MPGSYLSRSWEVSSVPDGTSSGGAGKGNRNPATHADEKSDIPIVPRKSPHNGCSPAEAREGRGIAAGNAFDSPARRSEPGKCVDGRRRHTSRRVSSPSIAAGLPPEGGRQARSAGDCRAGIHGGATGGG